jgi:hypothetical protein
MTSIQKPGLNVFMRSFLALLFVAFVIQSAIPMSAAQATTPQFHTVTFDENDSPSDPVYSSQTEDAPTALTTFDDLSPSFVDSGYTFVNWNSAPDGSGTSYANGSTFSFTSAEVLYATWAMDFHTVTFDENDSPSDPVYSSQTENAPTALTSFADLSPSFVDSGYTFVSWNSAPDGSGTSYANGSTFGFASAEVLYATWAIDFHTVTFDENDSPSDPIYSSQTENAPTALTSFTNLSPSFGDSGFTFVDWNTEADGGGVAYGDGSNYSFAGPIILYAIWSAIPTTTLTFETTSGTGSVGSISGQAGSSTMLPSGSGLSNPGYSFTDWNTVAIGSGTDYQAGAAYVFSANQTLYAQWSPDTYMVSYSYDGGVATIGAANYVVGTTALVLPTSTLSGSTFDGWFTARTGGTLIGVGGSTYVPTESIQVFAQWTSVAIDVLTFDSNGGTGSLAPYSGENGSSTALPTIDGVTNLGFAFSGWNTQADGGGTQYSEGENLTLSGSETLYAQWTAGSSDTLTFNANGGSGVIDPISGTPGSTVTLPYQSGLIRAGFKMTRWNTSASGKGTSYSVGEAVKLSESIVLYAQWSGHKVATLFGAIGTFKAGSSSLSAALKSQIIRIAITIKTRKYDKVDLFGYTAATGLRSLNISLSRARARKVASFLRNRLDDLKDHGVSISSTGEGSIVGQSSNAYSRVEVFGV